MKNTKEMQKSQFETPEEEREYWESHGPLAKGARGKIDPPASKESARLFFQYVCRGKN